MGKEKTHINLVVIGHVDSGKSTTTVREGNYYFLVCLDYQIFSCSRFFEFFCLVWIIVVFDGQKLKN